MPDFETSDGVRLHYEDEGIGSPILCLSGLSRNSSDFDYVAPYLGGNRLIMLDYRGRGQSDWADPETYVIPREAGDGYIGFAKATGADCVALDNSVSASWAAANVQVDGCVQGNLASSHMVTGGQALVDETRAIVKAFSSGPHIFNLGHGITPDADPDNVQLMIDTVRETVPA